MAALSNADFAVKLLASANETERYCQYVSEGTVYYNYRPNNFLQAQVNTQLHAAMHHRAHQPEY